MSRSVVRWPSDCRPEQCPVYAYNELRMDAAPELAWAWLIRAERWSDWYANCKNLRIESGPRQDLALATRFTWTTFNTRIDTTVEEFVPCTRLAWRGGGMGVHAYHAWVLEPVSGGVLVITEETQHGISASLGRFFLRRGLLNQHQRWLEGLARMARTGPPA